MELPPKEEPPKDPMDTEGLPARQAPPFPLSEEELAEFGPDWPVAIQTIHDEDTREIYGSPDEKL